MGFSLRKNNVLKVVHPGRHVEVFREPITAGEIMRKYPRHCVARPDVFEFPWIVVRPESLLVPGNVFYLVPYHTMNKLLKAKLQQIQFSKQHNHYLISFQGHMRWTNYTNLNDHHYNSWNKMRRKLNRGSCYGRLYPEPDSPLYSIRPRSNEMRIACGQYSSPEKSEVMRLRPCLRKAESIRQKLDLRVSFDWQDVLILPGPRPFETI